MNHFFLNLKGNEPVKRYLSKIVEKNQVPQSLLFHGPCGVGKLKFAKAFASLLLNTSLEKIDSETHPDFRIYRPEGKSGMHSIETMRSFSREVYNSPYISNYKVFIIEDADRMLSYSANALLKTFEEPLLKSIIILLSSSLNTLLPTILSRCSQVRFLPLKEEQVCQLLQEKYALDFDGAKKIAILSKGSMSRAAAFFDKSSINMDILQLLIKGTSLPHSETLKSIKQIVTSLEARKKEWEVAYREQLIKSYPEEMTALQNGVVEKEIEGIVAMRQSSELKGILDTILNWYRDLYLIRFQGDLRYLIYSDFLSDLEKKALDKNLLSLDKVQSIIKETILAFERSLPIAHCLETLFVRLHLGHVVN